MRDKIIGFIISVVCFIISLGFVKGQAMALPFVPTDWTWEMYQGLHMLGDLIANDVNFEVPDWVDFNDFDDVKLFLENIYNEGKKKVAYASIIADLCVDSWEHFLATGEVDLSFSEQNIKRVHNTGFFQHIADTISIDTIIPTPDEQYTPLLNTINNGRFLNYSLDYTNLDTSVITIPDSLSYKSFVLNRSSFVNGGDIKSDTASGIFVCPLVSIYITGSGDSYSYSLPAIDPIYCYYATRYFTFSVSNNVLQTSVSRLANSYTFNSSWQYSNNTYTGTLDSCLSNLSRYGNNINIYVNNEPWAYAGASTIDNPLGVVIPDNTIDDIQVGDTKGHVISATLPDTDNLVGSIDLGVVMDELREAQAQGREATLEKVKTKQGVKSIDGTVVDTKTKAVAIDVPVVSSVVASADDFGYIPYYPEIPSAFSGTTILSELIDATQNIIPNELIMAIWGLVIILFIIALIKIFYR